MPVTQFQDTHLTLSDGIFPLQEMHEALGALKTIHDLFSPKWEGKQHKSRVNSTCQEGIQHLEVLPGVRTFTPVRALIC